jgi:hypothetical protein
VSAAVLHSIRDLVQQDPGRRGLATVPGDNLLTACPDDFARACQSLAAHPSPRLAIITGFFIPRATPPAGETDGPLGALFLARALRPAGVGVAIATDSFCMTALYAGLRASGLAGAVPLVELPSASVAMSQAEYCRDVLSRLGQPTHLLALERVGPTHTPATLQASVPNGGDLLEAFRQEVPPEHRGRCHTMRGIDITPMMRPAHLLFEDQSRDRPVTLGIGDGGNEIGMGRITWDVIRRNIPGGGLVACRTATDHLIVCGVSNWGAYALAAGLLHLRRAAPAPQLFDPDRERQLLKTMVEAGPLVDGVLGRPEVSVDGLPDEVYFGVLPGIGSLLGHG